MIRRKNYQLGAYLRKTIILRRSLSETYLAITDWIIIILIRLRPSWRFNLIETLQKISFEFNPTTSVIFSHLTLNIYAEYSVFKRDLRDSVNTNLLAKYQGQRSFRSKVIVCTDTDRHTGPTALPEPNHSTVTIEALVVDLPLDDERQCGPGGSDDVLGLLLLHPTDVMVVNGNKHVSTLQATVRRTAAEHLHTVHRLQLPVRLVGQSL